MNTFGFDTSFLFFLDSRKEGTKKVFGFVGLDGRAQYVARFFVCENIEYERSNSG